MVELALAGGIALVGVAMWSPFGERLADTLTKGVENGLSKRKMFEKRLADLEAEQNKLREIMVLGNVHTLKN